MGQLKLATKIYLGFSAILSILMVLGLITIWNFNGINQNSKMLSTEYVPEVVVANEIERMSLKTMYETRGYAYTEETSFLEKAKENLLKVKDNLKKAKDLSEKSVHLVKLKKEAEVIDEGVASYEKELNETVKLVGELEALRKKQGENASVFMKNSNEFIHDQYEALKEDISEKKGNDKISERIKKIQMATELRVTGYTIRLAFIRSQAERDPLILKEGVKLFETVTDLLNNIEKITRQKTNLEHIVVVRKAGSDYKQGMIDFLEDWEKLQQVNKQRGTFGEMVLKSAEELAKGGTEGAKTVAEFASHSVNEGMTVLIIGLLIGLVLGMILSFLITKGITTAMNHVIEELRDSSSQIASASTQLSSAAQELSSSSNEQASSVEETSSSLEELSGMVENNIGNAEDALRLSNEVKESSQVANETMKKLRNSMSEILVSNEKIEALVKVIANIGEKTQIMDEIVFQTKLLSFNASVEAERAGEHGRGFAVVAQEVGNLAQMSGKAAQEIAQIVKNSITEAESITHENKSKVTQGNSFVEETAKKLEEIMKAATTVANSANQVVSASKDQAKGIKQINTAMGQVDKSTQENAATAEETASSSEELTSQVEALQRVIFDLVLLIEGKNSAVINNQNHHARENRGNRSNEENKQAKVLKFAKNELKVNGKKQNFENEKNENSRLAVGGDSPSQGSVHSSNENDEWDKI